MIAFLRTCFAASLSVLSHANFDCAAYVSNCSGLASYEAYGDCQATNAVNGANGMACRIQHLALAVSDPATHCPHAQPTAEAPCATEQLKTFNCSLYASTCSGVSGYEAYGNCEATQAVNKANGMACRIQHLELAVSDPTTHCPHAQPTATAPCATEQLKTFDCSLYASTCSGVSGYEAYGNCAATAAANKANGMACRIQHLELAVSDPATHCPHAQPTATAPCATEQLKTFDCSLYASTCSGVSGYEAYGNCAATVAANKANGMACRIQHLELAVSDPATHCPHAQPTATAPCATEQLKTFDCSLYASTCSGVSGYEAYGNCAATVAANKANGMACRTQHLELAVSDPATHCPHAQPTATAPCATEQLKTFDCSLYASTCSGVSGYEAYGNCDATVAVNKANGMACRIQHLELAVSDPATHCPHAQPTAETPCSAEVLKTFDCSLYVSTCSVVSGYEAYENCAGYVSANGANGMACRTQHLELAVADPATHCPHAQPNAQAPCNGETLVAPSGQDSGASGAAYGLATLMIFGLALA